MVARFLGRVVKEKVCEALVAVLQANENDKLRRRLSETEKERDGWKARCGA